MAVTLVNKIILIAGAWKESNGQNAELEEQFETSLSELQKFKSLSREEAIQMILKEVS